MAETEEAPAKKEEKDLIGRLTDAGEDAVQRLGELPGGKTMVEAANAFRDRIDDLAARIRSIDPLEKRVSQLEKRLDDLETASGTPAKREGARATTTRATEPESPS
jgi:hypothetical protein